MCGVWVASISGACVRVFCECTEDVLRKKSVLSNTRSEKSAKVQSARRPERQLIVRV